MGAKGVLVVNLLSALFLPCWSQVRRPPRCQGCSNSPAPGDWTSRVNAMVKGPLDAATNTATQFVSWRADPNLPPGGQYVVATRIRFSAEANWNISQPTNFTERFVLELLPYSTPYDVLVCYDNVTLSTLPAPGTNSFVPECGLCRACFTTSDAPMLSITEATIEDNFHKPNVQYECVAVGTPSNISFVWYAKDTQNNSIRVAIPDSMVETSAEDGKTESELELKRDGGRFENPSCTASNGFVTRTINPRDFETRRIGIQEATMQVVGSSVVYRCEAIGQPLNEVTVFWDARRSGGRSGSMRMRIPDDDQRVSTRQVMSMVVSTLTLDKDGEFSEPRCTAMLDDDDELRDPNANFEEIQMKTELEMTTNAPGVVGKSSVPLEIIIPLLLAPLILTPLGVFLGFMCYRRCRIIRKKRKRKEEAAEMIRNLPLQPVSNGYEQSMVNTSDEHGSSNATESRPIAELRKKLPDDMIIDPTELKVSVVIGQGEFGVIYKAHYYQRDEQSVVAVKTLKGLFTTAGDIENAIKEILKMYRFNHPNVMSLVGVCMDPSDQGSSAGPSMVMPFMAKGSLLDYLRKEASHLKATTENEIPKVRMPLLQIIQQIAKGMEYLSGLNFVHRDLAARNCLMDASGVIKVSDFGLAENLYSRNYFREVKDGAKLPIKWMALESIKMAVFTEKSDVWAYGVTVWEVFTAGSIPYPGLHPREVLDSLESGHRLKRPKNMACCPNLYKHMLDMWHEQPESRPTFSAIVQTLEHFMEVTSNYLDLGSTVSANPSNASGEDERREQMSLGSFSEGDEITSLSGDGMNRHSILERVTSSPNDYTFAGDVL